MADRTDTRLRLTLGVLLLVYILNFLDRQIVGILAQPIAEDLGLSDLQIGLMTGLAFALFYTGLGVPIARFADRPRTNRVKVIGVCLAIWSAMTVLCGAAQNFLQMFLARVGVGIGEAGGTPPAHSLISQLSPPEKRASALGFYQLGPPIGGLIAMVMGGYLADTIGWRWAFVVVGAPGILLALAVVALLRDPRTDGSLAEGPKEADALGFREAFAGIVSSCANRLLLVGVAFSTTAIYGMLIWVPIFFQRSHELSAGQTGLWFGLANGIGSVLGVWGGGQLGDRMRARGKQHLMTAPAIATALCCPLLLAGLYVADWRLAMWLFFPGVALLWVNAAPVYSAVQGLVPPASRATASAAILLMQNLFGLGLGSPLIGELSDKLKPEYGAESVRVVLAVTVLVTTLVAAVLFWRSRKYLPEELDRAV